MSDEMGQIPATEALGCRWVPIRRLRMTSMIVVGHTYRVIYITRPSQNLEICTEIISKSAQNDPRANTLLNYQNKNIFAFVHR